MRQQLQLAFKFVAIAGIYLFTRSRTPPRERRNPEHSLLVIILLGNLRNSWIQNGRLIAGAETDAYLLEKDIVLFKAFLEDDRRRTREDAAMDDLAARIREVIAEAEALIPESRAIVANNSRRNLFQKVIGVPRELRRAAEELRELRRKIKEVYRMATAATRARAR
ncbi:hypothetical protein M569_01382 [Genlisea aurea]|uniref:Uncharacterized protein n=1 Tax=Genlisea aurea TaxID=192259 RepID=S8D205_9LAMI|nr:hypothetical protein M569_01382 [Genlisea aurea]